MSFVNIEYPRDGICLITLNRPERMNAMAFDVMVPFKEALEEVSFDNDTRVVIVTGAGGKAFLGGADISELRDRDHMARVLRRLKERGVWLAGAADQADQDIYQADLDGPLALVMGSEGRGMRRLTSELCDFLVRIPMQGQVSSLNVSVATAVCLFEIARQRDRRPQVVQTELRRFVLRVDLQRRVAAVRQGPLDVVDHDVDGAAGRDGGGRRRGRRRR